MAKKFRGAENKALAEAMRELRKGSRTSPHQTRDKRLRTDERILAHELSLENDNVECPECGNPDCERGWRDEQD